MARIISIAAIMKVGEFADGLRNDALYNIAERRLFNFYHGPLAKLVKAPVS